jgi:hypothetical protein
VTIEWREETLDVQNEQPCVLTWAVHFSLKPNELVGIIIFEEAARPTSEEAAAAADCCQSCCSGSGGCRCGALLRPRFAATAAERPPVLSEIFC